MKSWLDLRPPGGGIALLAGLCMFAGTVFVVIGGDSWYTRYVCPLFLPLGIGLWLKHSWARWIALLFFVFVTFVYLFLFFNVGVTVKSALKFAMVLATVYSLWDWDVYPESGNANATYERELLGNEPSDAPER